MLAFIANLHIFIQLVLGMKKFVKHLIMLFLT